jgi:hypothetical protein
MPRTSCHPWVGCGGATTCDVHPLVRDPSRVVALTGADNFRDLGGYPIPGGGEVARGLVYRSDGLQSLTDDDLRVVEERGITTVIDLRHQRIRYSTESVAGQRPAGVALFDVASGCRRQGHRCARRRPRVR